MTTSALHYYRMRAGMTQGELAQAVGMTQGGLARIERGGRLLAENAHALARVLAGKGFDFSEVLEALCNPEARQLTQKVKRKPGAATPGKASS